MAVKISSKYLGDFRVTNTHGSSKSELITDAPTDNMGKGESFSPTDLLVSSLASCIITTMTIVAARENFDPGEITCEAEKHMSDDKPRRISLIKLNFTLDTKLTAEQRQKLESIATNCPVHHSLAPEVVREVCFNYA
jgi:putative redox protein